jgi:antitoxin ParD1/3/4
VHWAAIFIQLESREINRSKISSREVFMAAASNFITVDLGPLRQHVEERVQSGLYENADQVIRAGLEALDREEAACNGSDNSQLIKLAEETLADPRPSIPAGEVFRKLRAKYGRPVVESQGPKRRNHPGEAMKNHLA